MQQQGRPRALLLRQAAPPNTAAPRRRVPGVYLMSPLLHSLTRNISEDSVIALITGLCIMHLALHDYK